MKLSYCPEQLLHNPVQSFCNVATRLEKSMKVYPYGIYSAGFFFAHLQ